MSLQRTALRLGAIGAILADPVLGPMLDGRVYDSLIAPFQSSGPVPSILVYTEDDKGPAFSSNGGPDFNRTCDLTFEIVIGMFDENADGVAAPITDRKLESKIDLIEDRIVGVADDWNNPGFARGQNAYAAVLNRHVLRRMPDVASSRYVDDTLGRRIAVRVVTIACAILTSGNENFAPVNVAAPYNVLPISLQALSVIPNVAASILDTLADLAACYPPFATEPAFKSTGLVIEPAPGGQPGPLPAAPDPSDPQFTANPSQS